MAPHAAPPPSDHLAPSDRRSSVPAVGLPVAVSWLLIVAAVAIIIAAAALSQSPSRGSEDEAATVAVLEVQARMLVGMERLQPGIADQSLRTLSKFATSPSTTRRIAALFGGFGPAFPARRETAIDLLARLDEAGQTPEELAVNEALRTAIVEPEDLSTADRDLLVGRLGWFGEFVVTAPLPDTHPDRAAALAPATRAAVVASLGFLGIALAGLAGLVLLIVALVLAVNGDLRFRMNRPAAPRSIYLEAVAVYLWAFIILQMALPLGIQSFSPAAASIASFAGLIGSSVLGAVWPIVRGVPRRVAFSDLGLHRGRGFLVEAFCGLVGYLAILPIFALGIIATLLLASMVQWLSPAPQPSDQIITHPVVAWIAQGGPIVWIIIFAFAAGFAPFFEEIMFRGALFGDLRRSMPLILAAGLSALVFALIHPQGLIAAPALTSLAFGLAMLRAWRGSIIAAMTAHALHNGALIGAMILLLA